MRSGSAGSVRLLGYLPDRCYILVGGCVISRPCIPIVPIIMGLLSHRGGSSGSISGSSGTNRPTTLSEARKKMLYDMVLLYYPSAHYLNTIPSPITGTTTNPTTHHTKTLCDTLLRGGYPLLAMLVAGVCMDTKESVRVANSASYRCHRWLSEIYKFECSLQASRVSCLYVDTGAGVSNTSSNSSSNNSNTSNSNDPSSTSMSRSLVDIACCELLGGKSDTMDVFLDPEGSGGSASLPDPRSTPGRRYKIVSQLCMITGHFVESIKMCDLSGDDGLVLYLMLLHTLSVMNTEAGFGSSSGAGSSSGRFGNSNTTSTINIHPNSAANTPNTNTPNTPNTTTGPYPETRGVTGILSKILLLMCAVNKSDKSDKADTSVDKKGGTGTGSSGNGNDDQTKTQTQTETNCILLPTPESVNTINQLLSLLIKRVSGLYDTLHGTKKNPLLQVVLHFIIRVLSANSADFPAKGVGSGSNRPIKTIPRVEKTSKVGPVGLGVGLSLIPPKPSKLTLQLPEPPVVLLVAEELLWPHPVVAVLSLGC